MTAAGFRGVPAVQLAGKSAEGPPHLSSANGRESVRTDAHPERNPERTKSANTGRLT
jgi:hypothetical protein